MKQILLINDVVGYSHVGMAAMLPVLTYMGMPTFNLPTALVSNTLDYGKFSVMETTDYMRSTIPVWQQLGFRFDAVCTGLMFSLEQGHLVAEYCKKQGAAGTKIFVDPIMGDGGNLYNGITMEQVGLMKDMVSMADLCFPNYTEACYLAGIPFKTEGLGRGEVRQLVDRLRQLGSRSVVITSLLVDGQHAVAGFQEPGSFGSNPSSPADEGYFLLPYDEIPKPFHGTGDIFSAVLIGHLMKNEPLLDSTQAAMNTVTKMIKRNIHLEDLCFGIPIEQCLDLIE